jgi:hypothetical protein
VGFVLAHYAKEALPDREVLYRNAPAGPPAGVAAFVAHTLDPDPAAPASIRDEAGRPLELAGTYRHAPLSGVTWLLYLPPRASAGSQLPRRAAAS